MNVLELDQLGVLEHTGRPGVEFGAFVDHNAPHGANHDTEMALFAVLERDLAEGKVSTQQVRDWWAPPCAGPWARVTLFGGALVSVRPAIVDALLALNSCMAAAGYEATPPDCGAYNCRPITGGSKYSLHAYGIAVDINWQANPYGPHLVTDMPAAMIAAIEAVRTVSGAQVWRWGGRYSGNKDAMHFEVICSPAALATGIDHRTVPGTDTQPTEDWLMALTDKEQDELLTKVRDIHKWTNGIAMAIVWLQNVLSGKGRTVENPNGAAAGTLLGRIRDGVQRIEARK